MYLALDFIVYRITHLPGIFVSSDFLWEYRMELITIEFIVSSLYS